LIFKSITYNFLVLTQQIAYKKYIQLSRMSKTAEGSVPFFSPMSLGRTSYCCGRFCLL